MRPSEPLPAEPSLPPPSPRPRHKVLLADILEDWRSPRKRALDVFIGGLILASVTAFLYTLGTEHEDHPNLQAFEWVVVSVFAVEYLARFYTASDFLADLRSGSARARGSLAWRLASGLGAALRRKAAFMLKPIHVVDLLALLPALRVFRVARLFRLLRLLHLVSYRSSLGSIAGVFREHAFELALVFAFVTMVFVFAGTGMFLVEHENPHFATLGDTFWWAIVTMTTVGYGDKFPVTGVGRILAGVTMFAGICVIALPTAIVTSSLMDKVQRLKDGTLKMMNLAGHVVVCGLARATETVVREIERRDGLTGTKTDVVVLSAFSDRTIPASDVIIKRGDFTREAVLREAGADKASTVIILAERRTSDTPDETVDARSLLTALVVDALNPAVQVVVEVLDPEMSRIVRHRLPRAEVIESAALAPRIMAVGAVHHGVHGIIRELLAPGGNDFWEVLVDAAAAAAHPTFGDLMRTFRARGATALAIKRGDAVHTNPPDAFAVAAGDVAIFMARESIQGL